MNKVTISLCQNRVLRNKEKNLLKAKDLIIESAVNKAEIIILPEMFNCPYDKKYFPVYSESYPGETTDLLASLAKKYSVYIIGGSIPEKEKDRIFNTSFVFNRAGELIARHRKIHLFDVEISNGILFRESDTLHPGDRLTVFSTEFGKIGIAICYDMRFPELIRKMVLEGAVIVAVPAAFNMTTGPAHWHVTARARAIDNQVYFIAASPARDKKASYVAYGHSLVVDPWGKIMAEAGTGEEILTADIDLSLISKIRDELPLLKHRREEIYNLSK